MTIASRLFDERTEGLIIFLAGVSMVANNLINFATKPNITERVKISLVRLGYPQLAGLTCEQQGSTIVLRGELRSFYMAQVAQSIASKVPGVRRVDNQVTVATMEAS